MIETLPLLARAEAVANKYHEFQRYSNEYVDRPYTYHLRQVVHILQQAGYAGDEELLAAAWLHDTLEDTKYSPEELCKTFGTKVYHLVRAVTNIKGISPESIISTYPPAITLKLADRIANTLESRANSPKKLKKYKKMYPEFRRVLYPLGGDRTLWLLLDLVTGMV